MALFYNRLLLTLLSLGVEREGKALNFLRFPIGREAACPSARQMARDEARHGKALEGMLKRYFNK